ncbi:MAG TPA: MFS transporter [Smithella sp.]|nr:MFS transporter [Smithella sp.]
MDTENQDSQKEKTGEGHEIAAEREAHLAMTAEAEEKKSQFGLLASKRFAPFFWTQFLGAYNDNVFKNTLVLFIAYKMGSALAAKSDILINLAAGLFILPFFFLSATAGQIADKYEKSMLMRYIKVAEIIIALMAAFAFYYKNVTGLMFLLFLLGCQAAFFGPVKYSIIPQHLTSKEIVGGNAMVEGGTFLAILLGTISGGLITQMDSGKLWAGIILVAVAVTGWLASRMIPHAAADSPELKLDLNPVTQTWQTMKISMEKRPVFLSILGISWFWALGLAYLSQLPNYTRNVLHGSEQVVTLLLTMFSIGIGVGSLLCERLSGKKVELGLVPLGSLGLSIFGFDLVFAHLSLPAAQAVGMPLMNLREFLGILGSHRVLMDLLMIGVFGGLYIVPLYSMIQVRTRPEIRARVIAANNILNALFMAAASLVAALFIGLLKFSIPQFFLILVIMNLVVACFIYSMVPEFVIRFMMWVLSKIMYRVKRTNLDVIPEEGAVVLICNHVTFVDTLFVAGSIQRNIRFVMDRMFFKIPVLNYIFRKGRVILIASKKDYPDVYEKAFDEISQALREGEPVCIFPEGKLTLDGNMDIFKPGIEKIIARDPVTIIPLALRGLWGSFFSRKKGSALSRWSRGFRSKVEIIAGEPIAPEGVTAECLHDVVSSLRGDKE